MSHALRKKTVVERKELLRDRTPADSPTKSGKRVPQYGDMTYVYLDAHGGDSIPHNNPDSNEGDKGRPPTGCERRKQPSSYIEPSHHGVAARTARILARVKAWQCVGSGTKGFSGARNKIKQKICRSTVAGKRYLIEAFKDGSQEKLGHMHALLSSRKRLRHLSQQAWTVGATSLRLLPNEKLKN